MLGQGQEWGYIIVVIVIVAIVVAIVVVVVVIVGNALLQEFAKGAKCLKRILDLMQLIGQGFLQGSNGLFRPRSFRIHGQCQRQTMTRSFHLLLFHIRPIRSCRILLSGSGSGRPHHQDTHCP
jgi:hypothetical protein